MKLADAIEWMKALADRRLDTRTNHQSAYNPAQPRFFFDPGELAALFAEADAAIKSTLPPAHPVLIQWNAALSPLTSGGAVQPGMVERALAIFRTALKLASEGRLASVIDTVRAETLAELLDQADVLVAANHLAAAAVIAGGCLETRLRELCEKHGISPSGDGSIAKYEGALAQLRKSGTEVLSIGDGKDVIAWGDRRNEAAHTPATFSRTQGEVRLMIDGIRQFIGRTAR